MRKKGSERFILPIAGLGRQQTQKSLELLGMTINYELKFLADARNIFLMPK
jgi:hypothetical protein